MNIDLNKELLVFKGKRVLITGHTGFKGSWLALWLCGLGAEVMGFALPPKRTDDHFNLLDLKNRIHHIEGDIRNGDHFSEVCMKFKPEFIFHLAAQALVRASYDDPKSTFDTNILGSVNVLEAARSLPSLKSLVFITSDKCYFNKEWTWGYRENDELGGRDPYSASKAAAEIIFSAYQDSFFPKQSELGAATTRAGNVIGGGDWALDRIVPDCIQALSDKKNIIIRSPNSTRPWQHVLEPLSGYLILATKLAINPSQYRGAWNFGPDGSSIRTVENLTRSIIERWGSGELIIDTPPGSVHEARLLHLSIDKAIQYIGWHPRWNFEQTVNNTVDWYKAVLDGQSAYDVSCYQIKKYMENSDD